MATLLALLTVLLVPAVGYALAVRRRRPTGSPLSVESVIAEGEPSERG